MNNFCIGNYDENQIILSKIQHVSLDVVPRFLYIILTKMKIFLVINAGVILLWLYIRILIFFFISNTRIMIFLIDSYLNQLWEKKKIQSSSVSHSKKSQNSSIGRKKKILWVSTVSHRKQIWNFAREKIQNSPIGSRQISQNSSTSRGKKIAVVHQ